MFSKAKSSQLMLHWSDGMGAEFLSLWERRGLETVMTARME